MLGTNFRSKDPILFASDSFFSSRLHSSRMVSFAKVQDLSSASSSFTSSSLSSILFEIEVLLETPYVGEVYFPTLLAILHPEKEEKGGTAMHSDPSLPTRAP